jgi:hypothetical protein
VDAQTEPTQGEDMKLGLVAASLVLVAGGAVGCGGDDSGGGSSSSAPSTTKFCGALKGFQDDFAAADPTKDLKGYIKSLKDAADKLEGVGTPKDIPSDAKAGFQLYVDKIKALDDNATVDDLAGIGDVSDADQTKLDALDDYVSKTCPDLAGETVSSGSPSSSP